MIKFDEAAEKIGADTIRYMYDGCAGGKRCSLWL